MADRAEQSESAAASPRVAGLPVAVSGLELRFGGIKALANVDFTAPVGEITAIIGPNGAGKTSVFNTISGFYRPAAGRILLGDRDITHVPIHARAALGLARTFQNIALFRGLSVLENIKLGGHGRMRAGVLAAMSYSRRARAEEMELRRESSGASSTSSSSTLSATAPWARCPTACRSGWRWRARSPCGRGSCCSTSPSPG